MVSAVSASDIHCTYPSSWNDLMYQFRHTFTSHIVEACLDFLEVIEREKFANVMFCTEAISALGLVALFATKLDARLTTLGLGELIIFWVMAINIKATSSSFSF